MSYIGQTLGQGKASRTLFTASGGETAVTVENGYQVGQLDVFLNGVKLVEGEDYTASNGTTITGLSPALSSTDKINFIALDTFSISDSVPASGGTFTGNVTAPSLILTPRTVPTSPTPVEGQMYYNDVDNVVKVYNGSTWDQLSNKFSATGGTESTHSFGGTTYKIHTFTSSGTFTVTAGGSVDVLVVAGGGAGSAAVNYGGAGGAGGLIWLSGHTLIAGTYATVIGAGASGYDSNRGNNGGNTTMFGLTAIGGGGGGFQGGTTTGKDGGSGGGGGYTSTGNYGAGTQSSQSGDSGTYGFGNNGGFGNSGSTSPAGPNSSGGGGGAGGAGTAGDFSLPPRGGVGKDMSTYVGTSVGDSGWFASGGGGSNQSGYSAGTASAGGGGDGANYNNSLATHGDANTGGGGGCGTNTQGGRNGGSGVVIVRYVV
jgi:hypothetical protein